LFLQPTSDSIKSSLIIDSQVEDILCWKLTPNGKCNSKSTYKTCLQSLYNAGMPRPVPTDEITKKLLNEVWKCKAMIPRVKTFVWRLLRKAISTSDRVARYSKHIENLCCRCGLPEDDFHLFFNCPFARAAWFHEPWFIRADFFTQNSSSFAQIILNLLAINHPYANLLNICTFLWCLWKAETKSFFAGKKGNLIR
jgi:hypothetical protein